jgi:catechol 2,3-dioxygenase-like lactoylglutathione lyase family enzyme
MLGDHVVFPIILSKDLELSRAFYEGKLGLEVLRQDEDRVLFRCGNGSQLTVSHSTVGTADTQTQAAWIVPDIHAELADLRARGVKIEQYEAPNPVTDADGIADVGPMWAAWFIDPSGNALSIIQRKAPPSSS